MKNVEELVPEVESAFARLHAQLRNPAATNAADASVRTESGRVPYRAARRKITGS